MIEPLIPAQSLDNDIAVVRILQLMGQLSPNDIKYIFQVNSIFIFIFFSLNQIKFMLLII